MTLKLGFWIPSYGGQAEVLQPKSLRNDIICEIRKTSKRYELEYTVGDKIAQKVDNKTNNQWEV